MTEINVIDRGIIEYGDALDVQHKYLDSVIEGRDSNSNNNVLLYCEHPHVYTLGKSGVDTNLLISDETLKRIEATFFRTDRGGDITYHGYGQVVGYPIIDLHNFNLGIREYIYRLEECVIKTIAEYGICGVRIDSATGVWVNTPVGERKICAIGVKVSRHVTMHGFALNVNTDLAYFRYINPCGFTEKGVTSIRELLGREIDMDEVKQRLSNHFRELFT